jgi:hypothetical protein
MTYKIYGPLSQQIGKTFVLLILIVSANFLFICSNGSAFGQAPVTVLVDRNIDPKDRNVVRFDVLPQIAGKSYSGHLSALFKPLKPDQPDAENAFAIWCTTPDLDGVDELFPSINVLYASNSLDAISPDSINLDFSCLKLTFVVWDDGRDAKESGPVKISAVLQYQTSSQIKEITDPLLNATGTSLNVALAPVPVPR